MENPLNSDDNEVRRRGRRIFSSLRKHVDEPVAPSDRDEQANDRPADELNEVEILNSAEAEVDTGLAVPSGEIAENIPEELESMLEVEQYGSSQSTPSEEAAALVGEESPPAGIVGDTVDETVDAAVENTEADQVAATVGVAEDEVAAVVPIPNESEPIAAEVPVTPPPVDLAEVVGEAPEPPTEDAPLELPRVVAITNQKGGVGKTTTSVNLGAALAELGFRVLVIDLDPQGNASTGMGVNPRSVEHSVYEVILHDLPMEDAIEPTAVRNLFCVPATIDLAGAEIELVPAMMREMRLKQAIDAVKEDYDWVIIDCPPSLGLLTVNGLAAANDVIVPIQCEYYALEGLGQLLRNVSLIQQRINPALKVKGIVLTMFDARTRLAEQVESDVREHFGDTVYATVIPRTVRLSEAPSFGQPIIVFDPSSRGSVAYRDLAKEVARGATIRSR